MFQTTLCDASNCMKPCRLWPSWLSGQVSRLIICDRHGYTTTPSSIRLWPPSTATSPSSQWFTSAKNIRNYMSSLWFLHKQLGLEAIKLQSFPVTFILIEGSRPQHACTTSQTAAYKPILINQLCTQTACNTHESVPVVWMVGHGAAEQLGTQVICSL